MVVVVVVGAGSVVFHCPLIKCVAGVMVSIVAFQAVDPGSIPGRRIFLMSSMFDSVLFYSVANQIFSFVTKGVSTHDSTETKNINTRHNNFKNISSAPSSQTAISKYSQDFAFKFSPIDIFWDVCGCSGVCGY